MNEPSPHKSINSSLPSSKEAFLQSSMYEESNKSKGTSNGTAKKGKQNPVLSTSFVSTRRYEPGSPSPTSPLQSRRHRGSTAKKLLTLRTEINQTQLELTQVKKKKEDIEKTRSTASSDIFTGSYSTEHLQKHSMRIKTNTLIREFDKAIKKLERRLSELRVQYEQTRKSETLERRSTNDSLSTMSKEDLSNAHIDEDENSTSDNNTSAESDLDIQENLTVKQGTHQMLTPLRAESVHTKTNTPTLESATWLISDYMQSLQEANISTEFILTKANSLVDILKEHPELRQDLMLAPFMPSVQTLLLSDDKLVVSAAYRICRHLINGEQFVAYLLELRLDAFIVISFSKDNSYHVEREQALKLVRAFSEYKIGITKGIVQAVISCVEKPDDPLKNMALESLLELSYLHPNLVMECHGMRVFEEILQDYSSFSLASIILDSILDLMSTHQTRKYFLNDFNITILSSIFSDTSTKTTVNVEKMQNAAILVSKAFKNYNGIMLFSIDNFRPIKELLSFFNVPLCAQYLIDIFLDVLKIRPLTYKTKSKNKFRMRPSQFLKDSLPVNQHLALMILILDRCNFHDYVLSLVSNDTRRKVSSNLILKARYLLAEYMNLRMNLVDNGLFPDFNNFAFKPTTLMEETFQIGKMIQALNKNRNTLGMTKISYMENIKEYSQKVKESTLVSEVDDMRFRKMVYDSRVLQTKDFTSWNWNIIQELLEGPLMNKKQLEELAKSTKFVRRLLVFYRPLRLRFSNVDRGSRLSAKYVQVGCQFFKTLTINPEGMKILMDDTKIIPQVASLLFRAMEDNMAGNVFNDYSLKTKMIYGYFKFIGVLTQSKNGIQILDRWNFFTIIYKMFQTDNRISLKFLLLTLPELNLTYSPHCRIIIGKALVDPNEVVRIKATKHIGERLRDLMVEKPEDIDSQEDKLRLRRFKIEMLTRQLYDLSSNVVAIADRALYECILEGYGSKEFSFSLKTFLDQMVFIRSPILFELLSKSYGFQLLNDINFVEVERQSWLDHKNIEYVSIVEEFLSTAQFRSEKSHHFERNDRLPLHFYESLAKTEDGITLLSQSGDLVQFMNTIKKYVSDSMGDEVSTDIIEVKAALWCCGYIGSTELGIGLLDNYSLVEDVVKIANEASATSLRFTAFFILGLVSRTREGCEILDEMGWNCSVTVHGDPLGITLPNKLDTFLSFNEKKWTISEDHKDELIELDTNTGDLVKSSGTFKINLDKLLAEKEVLENPLYENKEIDSINILNKAGIKSTEDVANFFSNRERHNTVNSTNAISTEDEEDRENIIDKVLDTVSQLDNHILSNAAIKRVTELNGKYGATLFESEIMFFKVMEMMDKFRFKPHVRKFLCGLFINTNALENVIRHDRKRKQQQSETD
ncbi:hypothetical protein KAFR_0K01770 [Kazachstania africana CBS 2517]|uniref:REM-1 domain-containing protein n=1 Tax=Kazachstania africana (strain ATCC 22294 / BCRC 22015 / CBS 2517 / CECT 1963 / NBRC 1671 / NRRL Y-8276) TaxID=1071382 RepID=H2B1N1_KAZAF|nr:hypothetical protein KAFR_0K01770 [Kazachstania africana CBS 2517]CCF60531.1 hypothetical protein KAFR_0K01770 [Kazachstania africana CBS 2517]